MTARAIYYDTETTGIKADKDRIIEIAAFDPEKNKKFEKLINPGCLIPPDATAIHHITNEMVASAPPFSEVIPEFLEFCSGDVILIAHNNDGFDYHFLRYEFQRNQLSMPQWKFLDTLKWARKYRPDLPRHSLQLLREIYGIPPNNAHRALDDVMVLYQLFSIFVDDLRIHEVYDLLKSNSDSINTMPFGKHQGQILSEVPRSYVQWLHSSGALDKPENQQLKASFEQLGMLVSKIAGAA